MKKLSLMLVFVMVLAMLFAFSTFAAFVRGPEGETIAADDIAVNADGNAMLEIDAGKTTHGAESAVLDGKINAYWGGEQGTKLKVTFANEWEITELKAAIVANWTGLKISAYAADDTLLGSASIGNYSSNTGAIWGGNCSEITDFSGAVNKLTYGDADKAVKYIILENIQHKWNYLTGVAELYMVGRERIPTTGCEVHEFETVIDPEPTCTEPGLAVNVCVNCGVMDAGTAVPATGHQFGDYRIKTPATCTQGAVIEFECVNCGETIERDMFIEDVTDYGDLFNVETSGTGGWTQFTNALYDNNMDTILQVNPYWVIESAITLDMPYYISSATVWVGNLYWTTSTQGAAITLYYKAPGETEWIEAGVKQTPATADNTKYEYTLELDTPVLAEAIKIKGTGLTSSCGLLYEAKVAGSPLAETVAANHNWEAAGEAVAPTCINVGYVPYTCADCGATKQDTFVRETNEHKYTVEYKEYDEEGNEIITKVEPTCTEAGSIKMQCETCTATKAIAIDPLGHDMQEATCLVPSTCSRCGLTEGEVGDHTNSWSETYEYVPATCKAAGYEKDICAVCGEEYTVELPIDTVFGHVEIWGTGVGEDATCQSEGYYSYQCEICNETITTVLPADEYAHVWDETLAVSVPATCVADGYSYNKCSLCGTEVTEEFEANDWSHAYDNGVVGDGVVVYTCTLCGNSYEEELPTALPYGDTTAELVAVENEIGLLVLDPVYYSVSVPGNYVLTIKDEANVYVVYGEYDSVLIETSTFAFTLAENETITFAVMTADFAEGTAEINLASADNALINGTYVAADKSALFVFADGVLTVTDTNEMMPSGFAGTYTYNYNSVTGEVANTADLPMTVRNGVIFVYGRMPLSAYVPPMDVVLGDNEITVTNTNYFFDGIKVVFTATEAGTYVITASETGVVIVEGMNGSEMVELPFEVELAEGQAFEFIVTSSANAMMGENDTVVVNVAKKVTHVHVEEVIPAILPTPSVQGYTAGVKCADCDEIIVAPKAINVTEMANTRDPAFRIASANISLQDSIIVNYAAVVTAGYNNVYMVFEFNGEEYIYTDYTILTNGRYQFSFDKPEASNMNDNINAYVYAETADGEYSMNKILEYSIKQYAINQLKKGDAKLSTVVSDLLVMGAKTQAYSGYKANDLVTDAVIAAGYTLTPTAYNGYNADENIQALTGTASTIVDWKSAAVTLGSRTIVVLKFISNDLENTVAKITVAGETRTFTKEDFEWDASTSRWMVSVDYLTATQLNEAITATLELNGEQIGRTLTYSVNTYICRNVDKASGNTQELMKALYVYGKSCESYFGK